MMKWLTSLIVCIGIFSPSISFSQEEPGPKVIQLEHKGQAGYWFPEKVGRLVLADVKELKLVRQQLTIAQDIIRNKDSSIESCDKNLELADKQVAIAERSLEDVLVELDEVNRQDERFFSKPVVLVTTGAVGIVIIEIGLYFLISSFL